MNSMKAVTFGLVVLMGAPLLATDPKQEQESEDRRIVAQLTGYEEVPTLSTTGHGSFEARITKDNEIFYELRYEGLESDVRQAHIHFGRPAINGGIAAWLCGTTFSPAPAPVPPAAPTPDCVLGTSGTVSGVITAGNVIGPAGQGIAAGEFAELISAIRDGSAYANVHTAIRGGGEIRGVIR
jgi:CHRD domain